MGWEAARYNQHARSVAVGIQAGYSDQSERAIAVGYEAGAYNQESYAVSVGNGAGYLNQEVSAVGVGYHAGFSDQGVGAVAMGDAAAEYNQGSYASAMGFTAGRYNQESYAVAVGVGAGYSNQGTSTVAIGYEAGRINQGSAAVAVGNFAGYSGQHANSIMLNASGGTLNTTTASAFYVKPVRNSYNANFLRYDITSNEVTYSPRLEVLNESKTLTNGTWTSLVNFNDVGLVNGTYAIEVTWLDDADGATNYWYGGASGVIYVRGVGLAEYNSAPGQSVTLNHWYHYRTSNQFDFVIDSNNEGVGYGDASLWIKPYANTTNTFVIYMWRI
jgi:hypothetical protein